MRILRSILLGILFGTLFSCAILFRDTRVVPHYTNVDPQFKPYVNQYLFLAKMAGLKFHHTVNMGFTKMGNGNVVGITNYGLGFREVDISSEYWQYATDIQKTILIWHELGHSYCDRNHDFGKNKPYDAEALNRSFGPGYFMDECPVSIMYPYILDTDCWLYHYQDYVLEMFQRCDPY